MSVEQSGAAHQALDRAACRLERLHSRLTGLSPSRSLGLGDELFRWMLESSPMQENEAYDLTDELVRTIMKDGRQVHAASY